MDSIKVRNPISRQKPKECAILQSNYIPWKGYFDLIGMVDEFILLDDVQFTRRDWRNRNLIKTPHGLHWLTIPVKVKGNYHQKIKDTEIVDSRWAKNHWKTITTYYSRAPYFKEYKDFFQHLYMNSSSKFLSEINYGFLSALCKLLEFNTPVRWSMDYHMVDGKTERLVDLCRQVGANAYLSGPLANGYIDEDLFAANSIDLKFMDYSGYPEYDQLFPPFEHGVSVIDLIFHEGPNSRKFMKG